MGNFSAASSELPLSLCIYAQTSPQEAFYFKCKMMTEYKS